MRRQSREEGSRRVGGLSAERLPPGDGTKRRQKTTAEDNGNGSGNDDDKMTDRRFLGGHWSPPPCVGHDSERWQKPQPDCLHDRVPEEEAIDKRYRLVVSCKMYREGNI